MTATPTWASCRGGSGQGEQLAANKVRGVRAALCNDLYTARMARAHNDANVLSMGARVVGVGLAEEIVATFFATAGSTAVAISEGSTRSSLRSRVLSRRPAGPLSPARPRRPPRCRPSAVDASASSRRRSPGSGGVLPGPLLHRDATQLEPCLAVGQGSSATCDGIDHRNPSPRWLATRPRSDPTMRRGSA